jgi:hypothetical protein
VMDVRMYKGAEEDSDHFMVGMKYKERESEGK